jgi:hypothetical protein
MHPSKTLINLTVQPRNSCAFTRLDKQTLREFDCHRFRTHELLVKRTPAALMTPHATQKPFCGFATAMNMRHGSKLSQFNTLAEQRSALRFDKRVTSTL